MNKELLQGLSAQEKKELLATLQQEANQEKNNRREAYEALRAKFMTDVRSRLDKVVEEVKGFRDWLDSGVEPSKR